MPADSSSLFYPSSPLRRVAAVAASCLLACWAGVMAACEKPPASEAKIEPRRGSFGKAEVDETRLPARRLDAESLANMTALLAGMPPAADLEKIDPVWREHAAAMDKAYALLDPRLAAMRAWAQVELPAAKSPAEAPALFYPFGGPDLFSALALFPDAPTYVLVGLEAPGRLPLPEELASPALADDLKRLRQPFDSLVTSGYFVRTQIDQQLTGGHFDGLLPLVLIALARGGQVPVAVQYVGLDQRSGQVVDLEVAATAATAFRVLFRPLAEPEAKPRSVFYFAHDLSNDGIYPQSPFYTMVERLGPFQVYIKSGEYLCHTDAFSNLRRLILDRAELTLQDDSGVPLRFFTSDRWRIAYFGQYREVLAAYKPYFQADLAAAFASGRDVEPLPFSAGYHTTTSGGSLILTTRKNSSAAQVRELGK